MNEHEIDQILFERIEGYLRGTLAAEEMQLFANEVASNASLRAEVAVQRDNMMAVELGGFSRTVAEVVHEAGAERTAGPTRNNTLVLGMRIAASLVLLFGVAWWWSTRPDPYERAYAEFHVADPGSPVPMSATSDAAFHDAMVDYKVGAYDKAISKWNVLLAAEPRNDTLRYYLANAYSEQELHTDALPLYEGLKDDTASVYMARAEWRYFLTLLALKDKASIAGFKAAPDSPFAARIERVQAQLAE